MVKKINALFFIGTRPEGIKLAPLIKALELKKNIFDYAICSTGQHKEMLRQVFDFFEMKPDMDLDLMTENQSLGMLSSKILAGADKALEELKPDIIIVQGDTTTAFLSSLAAYYKKIKIGHVEAGLRTYDKYNPFPEEINRQFISRVADFNFAPTQGAMDNLYMENIPKERIFLTGNTIVDAILWALDKAKRNVPSIEAREPFKSMPTGSKIVLVTMHRRETFGKELLEVCNALKVIAKKHNDIQFVYPVHLNPNVRVPVFELLGNINNILLTEPMDYESFIWLMDKSYLIISDSGGIQEEAPTLNKPVLVIRKKTERMESVDLGISKIIGTDKDNIIKETLALIENRENYNNMVNKGNPYGDGKAAEKIIGIIEKNLMA
jgi:UDP-N-acetylglucosamine 2-epimerase (non-hydrolysing)